MPDPVVTRFAPSPTGFLHIGGGRTALFNWLLAKKLGGKMLLRIEDTDRARSTPEAIDAILDGLRWLGLDWDGEVTYQFARAARHREVAEEMLARGNAYHCYATPEELDAMREKAKAEGKPMRYDGRWRERSDADRAVAEAAGLKPVIRLKAPLMGETSVDDLVQGRVTWTNDNLDDLVLLRSDGNPTYMLAVVVDDHDMGVTHIVRGDDHLTNAARQTQIYQAMGWKVPAMAHIPLIHGADGAKLSKRHGALGVDAYRALGYLPVALRNYLVRLGWSHGDQEIFSTEEMVAAFDLKNVGRSPARFDFAKLENINGHYMRQTGDAELLAAIEAMLPHTEGGPALLAELTPARRAQWLAAMPGLKERAKTLVELVDGSKFLFAQRPLGMDDKAQQILNNRVVFKFFLPTRMELAIKFPTLDDRERAFKYLDEIRFYSSEIIGDVSPDFDFNEGKDPMDGRSFVLAWVGCRTILEKILDKIEHLDPNEWTATNLEKTIKQFAEQYSTKLGFVAQPLRAALTGRSTSPGIFDVFVVLGREESLGRIKDCL